MQGKLGFIPFRRAAEPQDGQVMTDRWWVVHPEYGIAFWQRRGMRGWSPQCNRDKRIAESVLASCYPNTDLIVQHVPVAHVGRWDEEYGHVPTLDFITDIADLTATEQEPI